MTEPPEPHVCPRGSRWALNDARGIFCCWVCDDCETEKRPRYCSDIFTDPQYPTTKPIKEDC